MTTPTVRLPRLHIPTLPFRWRLAITSQALVLLTIALMLIPLYVSSRAQILNVYRERLTAAALGASLAIPADTVDGLAASQARISVPYLTARTGLLEFWQPTEHDNDASPLADRGLTLVRATNGHYDVLAYSSWPPMRPATLPRWTPPPALADSLANLRAGHVHVYWFTDGHTLTAVAPILSQNSIPAGLTVARISVDEVLAQVNHTLLHLAWLPVLALIIAGVLASWLSGQLTRRVERLARRAQVLASGNLQHEIVDDSSDELGIVATSLEDLRDHLRVLLQDVQRGATEIGDTAHTLTDGSDHMRSATDEVASAARAIVATAHRQMHELDAIVAMATAAVQRAEAVTSFATGANTAVGTIATSVQQVAREGDDALRRMMTITAVTADAVPAVADLGVKSRRINTITASIARLANQANLLAVNAAIEAARSGEHGRGFAVIAEEIRDLADSTAAALDAIHALATEIHEVADVTSTRMREMQESVSRGEAAIRSAAQSLQGIVTATERGREAVGEITQISRQQYTQAESVSKQLHAVATGASENAVAAQQVSAVVETQTTMAAGVALTSHRLAAVATQLRGYLVRFEV
ncbi:MAG TPA: methyl-accepting chemotaxis protein [Gemmatimonadaceae bacterium]|nr:methyl-accepting chemotaxis protein [Gemmatimonadaceae bacterium]